MSTLEERKQAYAEKLIDESRKQKEAEVDQEFDLEFKELLKKLLGTDYTALVVKRESLKDDIRKAKDPKNIEVKGKLK
jgi:hypothetical protein